MLPLRLDDNRTLQAIGILADVLDKISGPTVLDTVLVSKALRQVLATKSQPALDFASRAFSTLDPDLREKIQDTAMKAAQDVVELRGRVSGFLADAMPKEAAPDMPKDREPPPKPAPVPNQPSSFLAALNARGRGTKPGER